jgi:hypothetical protein
MRSTLSVIPAQAGIQFLLLLRVKKLDPGLRRDDGVNNCAGMTERK